MTPLCWHSEQGIHLINIDLIFFLIEKKISPLFTFPYLTNVRRGFLSQTGTNNGGVDSWSLFTVAQSQPLSMELKKRAPTSVVVPEIPHQGVVLGAAIFLAGERAAQPCRPTLQSPVLPPRTSLPSGPAGVAASWAERRWSGLASGSIWAPADTCSKGAPLPCGPLPRWPSPSVSAQPGAPEFCSRVKGARAGAACRRNDKSAPEQVQNARTPPLPITPGVQIGKTIRPWWSMIQPPVSRRGTSYVGRQNISGPSKW